MFKRNDNMWLYALMGAFAYNLGRKHGAQQVLQAGLPAFTGAAKPALSEDPLKITLRIMQI